MNKLENPEERAFVRWTRKTILLCLKVNVLGRRGWPDRLVAGPNQLLIFFEFKRPDGKGETGALQEHVMGKLKRFGFKTYVVEKASEAIKIIEAEIQAAQIPK